MHRPRHRRVRSLALTAAVILFSGAAALLTGAPSPTAAATAPSAHPPAWLRCVPGPPGSGAQRCSGIRRIPLSGLSAADRSRRRSALTHRTTQQASGQATAGEILAPSQCMFPAPPLPGNVVPHPDRLTSCGDTAFTLYNIEYSDDGETILGTFDFEDFQWVTFTGTDSTWTHGMITLSYTGTGDLTDGFSAQISSECWLAEGACNAVSETSPDPQTIAVTDDNSYSFEWQENDEGPAATSPGSDDFLEGYLAVNWEATTPDGGFAEAIDGGDLAGRCDSIATGSDGCVDEDNIPTLYLSQATYGASAAMIAWAQQNLSGHWGLQGQGSPMTYLGNQALAGDNREIICQDGSFSPDAGLTAALAPYGDTDSCDEFPFAASYDSGAMEDDAYGNPKPYVTTGANCAQVTATQTGSSGGNEAADWNAITVTGSPSGSEPCVRGHIPGTLNSLVGGRYGNFVQTERLLDEDQFWVAVTS